MRRYWTGLTAATKPRAAPARFPYMDHHRASEARVDLYANNRKMEPGLHHSEQEKSDG